MEKSLGSVKKRDGRLVPFDKQKIADAIFKAAQSVGGQDKYLAEDLAEVVSMYLVKEYKKDVPAVEDIQDIVERVLIKTGHARTAKAYILYRQKRARVRKLRKGIKPEDAGFIDRERQSLIRNINLSVRGSRDNVSLWGKERITCALVKETGLAENIAELIVGEVEEEVITSKIQAPSSSLIRELVNAKLVAYGFEEERNRHTRLGVTVFDVKTLLDECKALPDELSLKLGRHIKKEFAFLHVFPDRAVERHLAGAMRIHNIEGIDKFYSANIIIKQEDLAAGETTEALTACLGPFIERHIVFNLFGSGIYGREKLNLPAGPKVGIEAACGFLQEAFQNKDVRIPAFLRLEKAEDVYGLTQGYKQINGIDISEDSGKNEAVLNKISLDISGLNENGITAEDIALLCAGIKQSQQSFMEKIYAARQLPDILRNAEKKLEIEVSNYGGFGKDAAEKLLHAIFESAGAYILTLKPVRHTVQDIRDIMLLLQPFIAKNSKIRAHYV